MKDSVEQKRETKKDVKYINDTHYRFDGAIAREYGIEVPAHALCNTKKRTERRPQLSYPGTNIKAVEPSLRSPYSVMQYFGRLLASDLIHRVKLIDAGSPRMPTGDKDILTVKTEHGAGECFASARHDGVHYCVPNKGANNTKELFVLLNTLINLSTKRESLPTTPTVQVLQ